MYDDLKQVHLTVIGLGYVGLPLAVAFAKKYPVTGFDIDTTRISELQAGRDFTMSVSAEDLKTLRITDQPEDIRHSNIYIITVPTPVDHNNRPDLQPLLGASTTVGQVLKKGDLVIYESTVYPGLTEEECVPVLERVSGLTFNKDFFAGYSPERINPGDPERTVTNIKKVTSGSTAEVAKTVDKLYASIITAGTHLAPSIKVAEAAKVIENAQRDINIAFINELAKICNRLQIDTQDVLAAASTKWNFLPFKPGLAGGHCIGIDPYYLAQKSQDAGYTPELILAGRRLNDGMGAYIAGEVIKLMAKKEIAIAGSHALVMGITFKENFPDVRNTKVIDIVRHLQEYQLQVTIYDPWANPRQVLDEYGVATRQTLPDDRKYDAIILAVAHRQFSYEIIKDLRQERSVIYDVKGHFPRNLADARL